MPTSGELGFEPVLHNITAEQVVFVYNTNKTGSLEVAEYYQEKRLLPNENLIGLSIPVPVPGATALDPESVILNEADYLYHIENPLIEALENLGTDFDSGGTKTIWVIILGFGIPTAYDDGGETIAVASRLHRLGKPISHGFSNPTFDRKTFKFFDASDAEEVFITAILDGPTVNSVKNLIDRAIDVDNQTFITGDIYVDPFGNKLTADDILYQKDISRFVSDESSLVGLGVQSTVDVDDPYDQPVSLPLHHDSFYWGWSRPTYSKDLLLNQNERRVFLYSADDRSASNIHFYDDANSTAFDSNGSDHWCNVAINADPGYACCAGTVAEETDPGSFLQPTPFFQTLHQGATMGEAFLFSVERISRRNILIGDPLSTVTFPVNLPDEQNVAIVTLPNDEIILREKEFIEESLAWAKRQSRLTQDMRGKVIESVDLNEATKLMPSIVSWEKQKGTQSQTNIYIEPVSSWLSYIQLTTSLTLPEWLTANNQKITSRLNDVISETGTAIVSSSSIYSAGYWEFTFPFTHDNITLENIFFRIEVSKDSLFSSLLVDVNSSTSVTGWRYEGQPFVFVQMPITGFPSNFSDRRIKFQAQTTNYLRDTEVYYLRWTASDINGTSFPGKTATQTIIISAGNDTSAVPDDGDTLTPGIPDTSTFSDLVTLYTDYFAMIAESGLERARKLFPGLALSVNIDIAKIPNTINAVQARTNLSNSLDSAYENLWQDGSQLVPMQDAFVALSNHILTKTGTDIDQYLTNEGITVKPIYARISSIIGETISTSNII